MKIDPALGTVSFPDITIGPHYSRLEFLQTKLGSTAKLGVVNDGWVTLHIQPEAGIYGAVAFKDDRLVTFEASMQMPSGEVGDYDRECELRRKTYHDAWLKSELGDPPYEYSWGRVLSWFDAKSVSSDIVVIFGKYPVKEDWRDRKRREREEAARKPV